MQMFLIYLWNVGIREVTKLHIAMNKFSYWYSQFELFIVAQLFLNKY